MAWLNFSKAGRLIGVRYSGEGQQLKALTGQILSAGNAPCPYCQKGVLRAVEHDPSSRHCDNCDVIVGLVELGKTAAYSGDETTRQALIDDARRSGLSMLVAAEIVLVLSGLWTIYSGSWPTLIGGMTISFVLLLHTMVSRYRAWQIEHSRLHELRAPFGDYVKWESQNIFGPREA